VLRTRRFAGVSLALSVVATCAFATAASAKPIVMRTLGQTVRQQRAQRAGSLTPPAPPCPTYGTPIYSDGQCTPVPEAVATTLPYPGNMAYYGGHVQTDPRVYVVYWGWGQPDAWKGWDAAANCAPSTFTETRPDGTTFGTTLPCDADGAGKRMADWVNQLGGTDWAGTQTQYYQQDASGNQTPVGNPKNQLAGIWVDDGNTNNLPATTLDNPTGPTNTLTLLGAEATKARQHFGITDTDNAQIVIAQPPGLSDPNSLNTGYCAFHDYTWPGIWSNVYNDDPAHGITIERGIAYTNMPYVLALGTGCGQNAVNSGDAGKLDGFSIVLGHEIEETTTDPGAEDVIADASGNPKHIGGWYDTVDANENADKCAWVGENLFAGFPGQPNVLPVPGAMGNIKGNQGATFAVQSLWSNSSAGGAGWCAGAGTDLPTDSAVTAKASRSKKSKHHAKRARHGKTRAHRVRRT
jgi:serine protease